MIDKKLIALAYRAAGKGCCQYPFFSIEDMNKFFTRKPYSGEFWVVMVVVDNKPSKKFFMFADRVAPFVEEKLAEAA